MKRTQSLSDEQYLDLYLKEISKYKPVKAEEEARLAKRIHQNDSEALDKLVKANLRFVVSVARNYMNQGMSLTDLINEGNMGLIKAAKRFDETKNFKFISYAVWWIRQSILQALAEQSRIVKVPLNRVGVIHKIGKAEERLQQRYKRRPDTSEIADELELNKDNVQSSSRIGNRHVSLDAPLNNSDDSNLGDLMHDRDNERPDERSQNLSFKERVNKSLNELTEREREITKLYFGIGYETSHTLDEIGERLSLTRERVRQVKENAIRKLKQKNLRALLHE